MRAVELVLAAGLAWQCLAFQEKLVAFAGVEKLMVCTQDCLALGKHHGSQNLCCECWCCPALGERLTESWQWTCLWLEALLVKKI